MSELPNVTGQSAWTAGAVGGSSVDLAEAADAAAGHVGVEQHAHELPVVGGPDRAVSERRGERVVDEVHVAAVRRDGRRGVVAAVARPLDYHRRGPRAAT